MENLIEGPRIYVDRYIRSFVILSLLPRVVGYHLAYIHREFVVALKIEIYIYIIYIYIYLDTPVHSFENIKMLVSMSERLV